MDSASIICMTDTQNGPRRRRLSKADEEQRRLRAAVLFAQGLRPAAVARTLGVSRVAAARWHGLWKSQGTRPLLSAETRGSAPKLGDAEFARLEPQLLVSPRESGFDHARWTLALIAELIHREFGIRYHPSQVRKILNALGWFHRARGRPRRGAKTGSGPFKWRRYPGRRRRGRREYSSH